mgnify:CR=1 FL=1
MERNSRDQREESMRDRESCMCDSLEHNSWYLGTLRESCMCDSLEHNSWYLGTVRESCSCDSLEHNSWYLGTIAIGTPWLNVVSSKKIS